MNQTDLFPHLPEQLNGLRDLAYNLWWSWQPSARDLFRDLGLYPWRQSGHNPIRMLSVLPRAVMESAVNDPDYMRHYNEVMARFDQEINSKTGWFEDTYGSLANPLAYMSFEYGLHASLPTYAGGLGILAGDYLKECSDLGIPLVAVGMIYSKGYVHQNIREDGWQEDVETELDRTYDPITPVLDAQGNQLTVQVPIFDPPLHVAVWKVAVGRVPLYLMDTDLEVNQPWERAIAQHLYASSPDQRLKQEIVLGMGGMKVLEAMGIQPSALHINEGHPAFAIFERIKRRVEAGEDFEQAFQQVRSTTVFTTHTPVPAGTDVFPFPLMEQYFDAYFSGLGTGKTTILSLGVRPQDESGGFNTTVFALRACRFSNAVSKRHGEVAREMWTALWPDKKVEDIPIKAITNGVHLPTWIELVQLQPLLQEHLGPDWIEKQDQPAIWEKVDEIPDAALWQLHQERKVRLVSQVNEVGRVRWQKDHVAASSVLAFGALLNSEILTIGFARRFTGYKRADLIFHDLERIKQMLTDPLRPLQIIFAGIAHPADNDGKRLIQHIFRLAQDPACGSGARCRSGVTVTA